MVDKAKYVSGLADMVATAMTVKLEENAEGASTPTGSNPVKMFGLSLCRELETSLREYAEMLRTSTPYSENAGIEETEG